MAAHAMQRPVIVCCETLKFVDRVQLDSITYNELGDPELLADVKDRPDLSDLKNHKEEPRLGEVAMFHFPLKAQHEWRALLSLPLQDRCVWSEWI